MKIPKLAILIFVLNLPKLVYSQSDDFGIWYGLNPEFSLTKKLDIKVSAMIRTFKNASIIEQVFLEAGASYKFNNYLSTAVSYRIIDNLEDNSEYHIRHKWFADVKGTLPLGNFSFSARLRLQVQTKTFYENEKDKIPDYHGRLKLRVSYNIPSFPVNPFLCIESFSPLFKNHVQLVDKDRFTLGLEYKIFKKQSIEGEYVFQRDFLPHISDINLISLTYNIKF